MKPRLIDRKLSEPIPYCQIKLVEKIVTKKIIRDKPYNKKIGTDSEYVSNLNMGTIPVCLTFDDGQNKAFYIHPKASQNVIDHARKVGDKIFEHDCAILDYLQDKYDYVVKNVVEDIDYKNSSNTDLTIFFGFKDVEFLFRNKEFYVKHILPKLSKIRRIRIENKGKNHNSDTLRLPYIVSLPDDNNKGKKRWYRVSIKITDICAMQGPESLKTYACNVGVVMADKGDYNSDDKKRMDLRYIEDHLKFKRYAMGDAALNEIQKATNDFYNKIAELIEIDPQKKWGFSTGKIVARILNDWFCKTLNTDSDTLYRINGGAGSEGMRRLSITLKQECLLYLQMVDGGRTVKERDIDVMIGNLIDIDISGCYGNGLKNQFYAIGNPSITHDNIPFEVWLKKFENELIAGLWVARISWDNAPFNQDLLISKIKGKFTSWNWIITGFDSEGFELDDDGKKVEDSSMCLTTKSVFQAALTHDLLQVLRVVCSSKEWGWILKNAVINSSAIYKKSDEMLAPSEDMVKGLTLSDDANHILDGSKKWVRIDFRSLIEKLLKERKKHPKGSSMNVFLKLIINTMYGCIASEFFSVENACVSSVVVGNNITARARCLVWCMSKGLHSAMSITDGGVFDINNVLQFKKRSLNLLEGLHRDIITDCTRKYFCKKIPLMGEILDFKKPNFYKDFINKYCDLKLVENKINYNLTHKNFDEIRTDSQIIYDTEKRCVLDVIDKKAWKHLASIFDIDIFKYNQFEFETKDIYTKLVLHSKVDYYLKQPDGGYKIAFRGMPKIYDSVKDKKIINPKALELFRAIEDNKPIKVEIENTQLLSLSDYRIKIKSDPDYPLLPHDTVSDPKTFYSHTSHGCRVDDLTVYNRVKKRYETAKKSVDALEVAKVKIYGDHLSRE